VRAPHPRGREPAASPPPSWEPQVLLGLLISLGAFGVDAMLPALTSLASTFRVGETQAQLVVGAYLLGFSWGQLLFGPLSDAWGRRRVLLAGLLVFWTSSAAVLWIRDFGWLVAARGVQGLFASSLRTVGTAWVRDRYRGEAMARVMALVQSVFVVAPVLAPWVGAYLARRGWPAVFAFLGAVGCVLWGWALAPTLTVPGHTRASEGCKCPVFRPCGVCTRGKA
jgi:MFS transporter, DHA1 family, multidrug resistance protein